ncbi:exocyst complex component EXO70B1-like [Malania oleifera]|uniref:exocyst complex component EXO70B1-like n=1 Tax=Malania oleifera TaxID=397392 RepID=UPI0025ADEB7A|nr:exocyst complex component EXO70B1-like [Malania oleifera]
MAEKGEEKLLAVARHIAKTLGHNDSMADDILQIFSTFDGRFSRDKLATIHDDPRSLATLEHALNALDRRISQYVAADHPIWSDSADSSAFLDAIDELHTILREWSSAAGGEKWASACMVRAEDLLHRAMFRLEYEFGLLMDRGSESFELSRGYGNADSADFDSEEGEVGGGVIGDGEGHEIAVAHPVTDYDLVIDALPSGAINDLNEIARRMVVLGFSKECSHVYSSRRREFLEESLSRLGVRQLSIEEVHKTAWSELEDEIERWIKTANVALRILFPSERRLCNRVFFGFSSAADLSFMEVCRGSTTQLLNFADAVAIGSRSPERLFRILDVFETLRDLVPEFEAVFADQYCLVLRNEAITIWKRLGEAIRGIFMELENLISRDPAKTPIPGGDLHPITRYVMNYLRAACRSRQTLEHIFDENIEFPSNYRKPDDRSTSSPLSVQMVWIMELLESNLEAKSKIYENSALSSLFLMNNERYIVQKVKDSELGTLLGEDWIRKHAGKVRLYLSIYQNSSWNKVSGVLKIDTGSQASTIGSLRSMMEKLVFFNTSFEDICKFQSQCVIFDEQLREDLRNTVSENLLKAYQTFLGKLLSVSEPGKSVEKPVRHYSVEHVHARISEAFQGSAAGGRK